MGNLISYCFETEGFLFEHMAGWLKISESWGMIGFLWKKVQRQIFGRMKRLNHF